MQIKEKGLDKNTLLVTAAILISAVISGLTCKPSTDITFISIGTGGTGGAYYPYGGGLAELWTRNVPGVKAVAEVTGASVENVKLAHRGETVIGEIMGDVAYQAYYGEGKFRDNPQHILALAVMYPNILQIAALRGSGIERLDQLTGRTVSTGAPGSGTAFMSDLVLDALGVDRESFTTRRLSFVENSNALRDHTIDAGFWCVAPPTSSIMDLATTHRINLISMTSDEQKRITARYPFYSSYELPAGLYRGLETAVQTIGVWNVIICNADLPDDLVYDLARVLFENNEYMKQIHPYAVHTTPENTANHCPIPLHPGASRYLQERGFSTPREPVSHD